MSLVTLMYVRIGAAKNGNAGFFLMRACSYLCGGVVILTLYEYELQFQKSVGSRLREVRNTCLLSFKTRAFQKGCCLI